jgi:hypothetical protein
MSRDKGRLNERNEAIKAKYKDLASKTIIYDKREIVLYRHEAILAMLSKKFWLSTARIGDILSEPTIPSNQVSLFPEE